MITNSMGAKKVEGTDNWREIFDAHNDTADALEQMGQDVAPIVNGNKSVTGAASGEYVLVRNSSITGITDGAYKAAQAIPANTTIDSTYLTAITGGALNDLNSKIPTRDNWINNAAGNTQFYYNEKLGIVICHLFASLNAATGSVQLPANIPTPRIDARGSCYGTFQDYSTAGYGMCSIGANTNTISFFMSNAVTYAFGQLVYACNAL